MKCYPYRALPPKATTVYTCKDLPNDQAGGMSENEEGGSSDGDI